MKFAAETLDEQYLSMTREQVARALHISLDTLDKMHARGEGPPRFRPSPKRWCYPAREFRIWRERRLAEQANNAA